MPAAPQDDIQGTFSVILNLSPCPRSKLLILTIPAFRFTPPAGMVGELIQEAEADTNAASKRVVLRHWLPAAKL